MQSSNRFPLYFIKDLKIYTLVDEEDIPSIIDYFQCYNIADIDNVSFDKEKNIFQLRLRNIIKIIFLKNFMKIFNILDFIKF